MAPRVPQDFSLRRAVLLGVCLTCFLGGLWVMVSGLHALQGDLDCGTWSAEECALEQELTVSFAQRQVVAGAALALLGVALLFPLRSAYRRPPPPGG